MPGKHKARGPKSAHWGVRSDPLDQFKKQKLHVQDIFYIIISLKYE